MRIARFVCAKPMSRFALLAVIPTAVYALSTCVKQKHRVPWSFASNAMETQATAVRSLSLLKFAIFFYRKHSRTSLKHLFGLLFNAIQTNSDIALLLIALRSTVLPLRQKNRQQPLPATNALPPSAQPATPRILASHVPSIRETPLATSRR